MAAYRVYCYDGADNISVADWIDAKSDDEALIAARAMKDGVKCEVWHHERFVGTIQNRRGHWLEAEAAGPRQAVNLPERQAPGR